MTSFRLQQAMMRSALASNALLAERRAAEAKGDQSNRSISTNEPAEPPPDKEAV
jgi:hypothetical protein